MAAGETLSFAFEGSGVRVELRPGVEPGQLRATLDGAALPPIALDGAGQAAIARGLSAGRHQLELIAPAGLIVDGIIVERDDGPQPLLLAASLLMLLVIGRLVTPTSSS
jgi:hypothetical protein